MLQRLHSLFFNCIDFNSSDNQADLHSKAVVGLFAFEELKSLQTLGAFDGWIGYTTPPSSHLGIIDTNNQVGFINA